MGTDSFIEVREGIEHSFILHTELRKQRVHFNVDLKEENHGVNCEAKDFVETREVNEDNYLVLKVNVSGGGGQQEDHFPKSTENYEATNREKRDYKDALKPN